MKLQTIGLLMGAVCLITVVSVGVMSVFTAEPIQDTPDSNETLQNYTSVKQIDDTTVQVSLTNPHSVDQVYIIAQTQSKDAVQLAELSESNPTEIVYPRLCGAESISLSTSPTLTDTYHTLEL